MNTAYNMQKYVNYMRKVIHNKTELQMLCDHLPPSSFDYNGIFKADSSMLFDFRIPHVMAAIQMVERESPEDLYDESLFFPTNDQRMKLCM